MADPEKIKEEYKELLNQLSDPELILNWEKGDEHKDSSSSFAGARTGKEDKSSSSSFAGARTLEELLKRKNFLEKIIEKEKEIEELKRRIEENKEILKSQEDQELYSLAETETSQLKEKEGTTQDELKKLLAGDGEEKNAAKAVIVEIRAGTGGEEAALFAADLFKMYSKYAVLQNWTQKVLDSSPSELAGLKEITFELKNGDVFSSMQYEAGVHRVQRIPSTEKSGRIHTSTASVAILPKPQKGKISISPRDLKVDTYKASGPGGQYVNKRMTAVRVTHLPTGLVVTSQTERNLQQNRENALSILEAKLLEKKELEETAKMGKERRLQIGKAQRAEKIRTYNFPQDRVTDHRIKKSFHNIEGIMDGKLHPIINSLQSA